MSEMKASEAVTPVQRGVFSVGPMREPEVRAVAQLHYDFFGVGDMHGTSIANFGVDFLADVFYGLNLDNPFFFVDVARYDGEIIAFSAYTSNKTQVFRYPLRHHPIRIGMSMLGQFVRHPVRTVSHIAGNFSFVADKVPAELKDIPGLYLLLGVKEPFRTREFKARTGIMVADELWDSMESTLRANGCYDVCSSPGRHNEPINRLFQKHHAELVTCVPVQGVPSNYYRKRLG
jgi:hypothetical protein